MIIWHPNVCKGFTGPNTGCVFEVENLDWAHAKRIKTCDAHAGLSDADAVAQIRAEGLKMSQGVEAIQKVLGYTDENPIEITWSFDEQRKISYQAPSTVKQKTTIETELAKISTDLTFTKL